jgi:hypothetical protein
MLHKKKSKWRYINWDNEEEEEEEDMGAAAVVCFKTANKKTLKQYSGLYVSGSNQNIVYPTFLYVSSIFSPFYLSALRTLGTALMHFTAQTVFIYATSLDQTVQMCPHEFYSLNLADQEILSFMDSKS